MNPIDFNASFLSVRRMLATNIAEQMKSAERLATGFRINSGQDDPAGLIASENLRARLASLEAEVGVAQRADQVIATADGALGEISGLIVQAEALAVANAGGAGMSDEERAANQMELDSILSSINRIASSTTFNGDPLLDGTASVTVNGATVQIDAISVEQIDIVDGDIGAAQTQLRALRNDVLAQRGELGAFSRHTVGAHISSLNVTIENIAAAESAIRDTDYAREISLLMQHQILAEASRYAFEMTRSASQRIVELFA
jgi:flagellin